MQPGTALRIAVFASDKGPGDPERASIMAQAGSYFARKGARLICLAEDGVIPVPLITAARHEGGQVMLVADETIVLPLALEDIPIEHLPDAAQRTARVAASADAFVGLPGSLASTSRLYAAWVAAGGGAKGKPVVLLNRHKAFEVVRGFAADVLSHGVRGQDRMIQFADTVEDLWSRVSRMAEERGALP